MTPQTDDEIVEFTQLFVRNPAEIEGIKRVEWRQIADDKVTQAQHWLRTTLATVRKEAYKKGYADGSIAEINKHNHEH